MYLLKGNIHSYEWGSQTLLAEVMGRPLPTDKPEAEAWFGAHPDGPSQVLASPEEPAKNHADLRELIEADPERELGPDREELPFLLKLLAARQALSIQVHPSKGQAEAGYARENAEGLAIEDPRRNYKDENHKPELLVAVSEFHALAGFRPVAETLAILQVLHVPTIDQAVAILRAASDAADGREAAEKAALSEVLELWLTLPATEAQQCVADVVDSCQSIVAQYSSRGSDSDQLVAIARTVAQLSQDYPNDPGILVALLLNRVTLQPGEALFLAAGQLHAYLSGLGVEVMANSNNVLRGGLTAKHIDVPELLSILDPTPLADPRCIREDNNYQTTVDDFSMTAVPPGESLRVTGPAVVLAAGGDLLLSSGRQQLAVPSGLASWIGYADGEMDVHAQPMSTTEDQQQPAIGYVATVGNQ